MAFLVESARLSASASWQPVREDTILKAIKEVLYELTLHQIQYWRQIPRRWAASVALSGGSNGLATPTRAC
jgi:hypothetical protein